jgi:pyruvate kinase
MTKILSTIGPVSEGRQLNYLIKNSEIVRLNMSHNSIEWHSQVIEKIKKFDKKKLILIDIPGVKPRTKNENKIKINKGQKINFKYTNQNYNGIKISNPLPKLKKNIKKFSLSDGSHTFKLTKSENNFIQGISEQNFILNSGKGLNIPMSIYDDQLQEKKYLKFLKKISLLDYDCIGLSFIQNSKIILKLKKLYPNKLFISKIENYLGYKNRISIIRESDAIMVDRGDLSAEVGISKLSEYTDRIIQDTKNIGKPVIIATENLNSLIYETSPSKSDVVNLDNYISKNVDYLMLSDETATSKNWKNTIHWLSTYLKKKIKNFKSKPLTIEEISKNLQHQNVVLFSKKGFFFDKIANLELKNLLVFTENNRLIKLLKLKKNSESIYIKFPKKHLHEFLFKSIKKYKKLVFKKDKFAYLINVIFPRKNSRANSISIIEEKDFIK